MKNFKDKVAVITGAGSGIGRALAIALARDGAQLALSDVNAAGLAETLKQLPAGTKAKTYLLDVSSQEAVFAHADEVKRDFGTVHLLFNNAGTTLVGLFDNQSLDEMRWLVNINLWGVIYGTKAFLPMMLAQREGVIVNLSSVLGLVGFPTHSAYNITKFGVRGLTESLWSELKGTGVTAVCVHPGGPRVMGPAAIRAAFEAIFANGAVAVRPQKVRRLQSLNCAVHSVLERIEITTADGLQTAWVLATNVYLKSGAGWAMAARRMRT